MKKLLTLIFTLGTYLCSAQQTFYDVTPGNGNGIRFWQQDNTYKIHMGSASEYFYGPVTDYSIKTNMSGGTPGRGWTWGVAGQVPVVAINTLGNMQIAGTFQSGRVTATGSVSMEETLFNASNLSDQDFNVRVSGVGAATKRTIIGPSTAGRFSLGVGIGGGNEYLTILNGGNVGIGTTSPNSKLVISDGGNNAISITPGASFSGLGFNRNVLDGAIFNPSISAWQFSARDGIFTLEGYNGASPYLMSVLKNGNVGIGTFTPSQKMHVSGSNAHYEVAARIENTDINNDSFAPIQFKTGASPNVWQTFARNGDLFSGIANVADYMVIKNGGNVGIGTSSPDAKLAVAGQVHAQEVKVSLTVPGPDYVFEKDYQLTSLEEIKNYIDQNKHLPEVPSAKEMEKNGVQLGEMNMLLLKKIEELTLYVIEQNRKIEDQTKKIELQGQEINTLKNKTK